MELLSTNGKSMMDIRYQAGISAIKGSPDDQAFVMYGLRLLREINTDFISEEHAYAHAQVYHNEVTSVPRTSWGKYVTMYGKEIRKDIAFNAMMVIADFARAFMEFNVPSQRSFGLPMDVCNIISGLDGNFKGYEIGHEFEAAVLSLRHIELKDPEVDVRPDRFIYQELHDKFISYLREFTRPIRDDEDLFTRTSKIARTQASFVLTILYSLFAKGDRPYWRQCDIVMQQDYVKKLRPMLERFPVRTPEGVFVFDPRFKLLPQSVERPMQIDGDVDRYLTLLLMQTSWNL
jgi:hypothetical protein